MSRENVELVRRGFEAINRGDIEWLLGVCDPDIDLAPSVVGGLEQTHFRGPAGYREWFEQQSEIYEDAHFDLHDVRAAGDQVVALYTARVRARQSGVSLESPGAAVFTLRNGLIVRQVGYQSQTEALEAVGLRE